MNFLGKLFFKNEKALGIDPKDTPPFVPPGHFYSPIPSLKEIKMDEEMVFGEKSLESLKGIQINELKQLELLDQLKKFYHEIPFESKRKDVLRYYFDNPAYSYSDAIFLYSMIRRFSPKKIVEIGSGFSSCAILDTNDIFFNDSIETTFVEPFPELLLSLIRDSDKRKIKLYRNRLQEVDTSLFKSLKANDILFIDSTHVSKINSDVNWIFFKILPLLAPGVIVHLHDIFFPFEYPKSWVYQGRSWNEAYLLRAFLQFNNEFEILLMNTFLQTYHKTFFSKNLPLCLKNTGGSIWIRRV